MTLNKPIAIVLIITAIIVFGFFWVGPQYNKFKTLQDELGRKMADYVAQRDYYAAVEKAYQEIIIKEDELSKIDDALTSDPVLGRTVYYLQQAAQENGLILKNLSLSKSGGNNKTKTKAESEEVQEISFSVSLLGSYTSLGGFLTSLESSSRIFEVASISFGTEKEPPYNFSLQIKTYSY